MAFGDPRGAADLELSGASVGATNGLTGSNPVVVGDLVLVCFAQQTALTASGVTDNLGNTYTDANAGTDGGNVTGRFFYSRVTVAGTLTTVTVAATASANDFAGCARAIEGPFDDSNLISGTTPANTSADLSSPFDCPSSGTLDTLTPNNLKRLVVGWATHDNNAGWSAGNGTEVAEVNRVNANAIISVQTTTGTGAIAPQFTGTNPVAAVYGTISFNEAFVPVFQQPPSAPVFHSGLAAAVLAAGLFWGGPVEAPAEEAAFSAASITTAVPYQRDRLYQSHFEPVVVAAPAAPGDGAYLPVIVETTVPSQRTLLYQSLFDSYYPVAEAEIVTPDKWYAPLAQPTRRKVSVANQPSLAWAPQPIAGDTQLDEWFDALSEPTRRKVSVANQPSLYWDPEPYVPGPDSWQRPLSEPTCRKVPVPEYPSLIWDPEPYVAGPDSWQRPLSEPVRRKVSVANQPSVAWTPQPIAGDTTIDEWYNPLSVPTRRKVSVASQPSVTYSYFVEVVEVVTLDKWFNPLSEPVRRTVSVASQPSVVWTAQPIAGDTAIDEWFRPLAEPTRRKVSVANQPYSAWAAYPFVAGPDSWQRPLAEPTRRKVSVANQPYLSWSAQPIAGDTTVDEWHNPLSEPTRRRVRPQPGALSWGYYTEIFAPGNNDTELDEYYRPLQEPVRRKVSLVNYQPYLVWTPQPIAGDTKLDEWFAPLQEPTRRAVRFHPPELTYGYYFDQPGNNDTELDEYYRPLSLRFKPPGLTAALQAPSFADNYVIELVGSTIDIGWFAPLSEPVRRKPTVYPDALSYSYYVIPPVGDGTALPFVITTTVVYDKTILYPTWHEPTRLDFVLPQPYITSTDTIKKPVDVVLHGEQVQYKISNYSSIPATGMSNAPKIPKSKVRRLKGKLPTFTTKTSKRGYD